MAPGRPPRRRQHASLNAAPECNQEPQATGHQDALVVDGGDRTCVGLILLLRSAIETIPPGTLIHLETKSGTTAGVGGPHEGAVGEHHLDAPGRLIVRLSVPTKRRS